MRVFLLFVLPFALLLFGRNLRHCSTIIKKHGSDPVLSYGTPVRCLYMVFVQKGSLQSIFKKIISLQAMRVLQENCLLLFCTVS
jgi:hypothetical protein